MTTIRGATTLTLGAGTDANITGANANITATTNANITASGLINISGGFVYSIQNIKYKIRKSNNPPGENSLIERSILVLCSRATRRRATDRARQRVAAPALPVAPPPHAA